MDKLTLLFVSVAVSVIATSGVAFECSETAHCLCYSVTGNQQYSLHCLTGGVSVDGSQQLVMKIEINFKKKRVVIDCTLDPHWNISYVTPLRIGAMQEVEMQSCNIPPEGFHQLLDKLGITAVKSLSYVGMSDASENVTLAARSFNGLATLETLHIMHVYSKFDKHVFDSMQNLTDLDLNETNVELTSTMFNALTKLKSLFLPLNQLQQLPAGIFHPLHKLQHLRLSSNHITMINKDLFRTLNKLKSLELSDNAIDQMPEDVFDALHSLETLGLMANHFQMLPANLFRHTQFLEHINMGSNPQLSSLPDRLFTNLRNLKGIKLIECGLTTLPPNLFQGSPNIHQIWFDRNLLESLPEGVFHDLNHLGTLNLRDNRLHTFSDKVFYPLKHLHFLNLRNNSITRITSDFFPSLEGLKFLDLSHNQIKHIQGFAFQKNTALTTLLLADNKLTYPEVHRLGKTSSFFNLINLKELDLSGNFISSLVAISEVLLSSINLTQINLANNQLKQVKYIDFRSISRNKIHIDLTSNQIAVVDLSAAESDLHVPNIPPPDVKLTLANNPIQCNCSNYDLMRYFDGTMSFVVTKQLEISIQDVSCLNDHRNLTSKKLLCPLEAVQCPNNCQCFYRPFNKAFIVDCSKLNLTTIPDILLPSDLQIEEVEIDLKHNRIKQGPMEADGYENVTTLLMSHNAISDLSWLPRNIKVLHLHNNNLTAFDVEMLDVFRNSTLLANLSLHNNPWRCDCEAERFTSLLRNDLRRYVDVSNIRCSEDQRALINLNKADLCSNETMVILVIFTLFISVLFLIAALVACYYCYQEEIKVWLYAHNMCLWFVTEEEVDKDKLYDAFLSFSHNDEEFVVKNLVPILEEGPQPYKLCLHFRNWIAGEFISTQIARSVESSRRTIVVLSRSFLKSVWGKMEFRTAHKQAMSEGRARVIVVVLGDVNLQEELDDELKAYLDTNTYVQWGDPWFWDKLRYAFPHSKKYKSINDELNLVRGPTTPNLGSATPSAISLDPILLK